MVNKHSKAKTKGLSFCISFSNAFSGMNVVASWFKFHWNLFPRIQLTTIQQWLRYWLGTDHIQYNKSKTFHPRNGYMAMLSAKWQPFCLGTWICLLIATQWCHMASWIYGIIGSDNNLFPDGIKPLPVPIFSYRQHSGTNLNENPHSKVHGANMGPIWGRQDPGGPHVDPKNFAIWEFAQDSNIVSQKTHLVILSAKW